MNQPVNIEAFFTDLETVDFTSSDEEEICKAEFTKEDVQKLCQFIPVTVNMKRRNLYYAFEKKVREQFMGKNIHLTHEQINKMFKKKFKYLYHEKYVPNEEIHEKNLRREKRFRRWDSYLYLRNCLNNDARTNSSQTETSTLSKSWDTVICTPGISQSQEAQVCEINGPLDKDDDYDDDQVKIISECVDNSIQVEIIPGAWNGDHNNDESETHSNVFNNNNNDQVEIINNDNSEEESMPLHLFKYLHNAANKPYQTPTYSQFKSAMINGPITSTQQSPTSP